MTVAMPFFSLIGCILWKAFCWLDFVRPLRCCENSCTLRYTSIKLQHFRSLFISSHAGLYY